ncbi:MAG: calcium-binding protein [Sporichthyaceae bacterium]
MEGTNMYRFTPKRIPLWVAASTLVAAGLAMASPEALAQSRIDAVAICTATPADEAAAQAILDNAVNGLGGYTAVVGTDGDDDLKGSGKNEVIWGLGGADKLKGGGGNDVICGGVGNDQIKGGSGTNHLHGGGGDDQLKGGGGTDYVYSDNEDVTAPAKPMGGVNFTCPTTPAPDVCI